MQHKDKLDHFVYSALGAVVLGTFIGLWPAALLMLAIGVGKELWDYFSGGTPDLLDIAADIFGITFGVLFL